MTIAANIVLSQIGWFAAVLGAAYGAPLMGTLAVAAIISLHLARTPRPSDEVALIAAAALMGAVFDSILASTGVVTYASGQFAAGTAPYWIVAMWALFATTLNVSLRWLKGRPYASAAFGAVGGPLAYYAGSRLGGIAFDETAFALASLAVIWALAMPGLMALSTKLDGWSRPAPGRSVGRRLVEE